MKKEELAWVFGGLEEGSGTTDGEKKKEKKERKRTKEEMVNRKSSLKDSISTWIF